MVFMLVCIFVCLLYMLSCLVPISEYYRKVMHQIKTEQGYKKTFFGYKKVNRD